MTNERQSMVLFTPTRFNAYTQVKQARGCIGWG